MITSTLMSFDKEASAQKRYDCNQGQILALAWWVAAQSQTFKGASTNGR